jgi:putative membrane protein
MKLHIALASAAILALGACGTSESAENATNDAGLEVADNGTNEAVNELNSTAQAAETAASGQEYATKAAGSDMYEIESARIAADKSKDADVKALAAMIRADHEKSTADLKAAAAKVEPAITVTPAMTAEQTANIAALRAAADADFDRVYLEQQVAAHEKALAMVQDYADGGDVASLKEHASKVVAPITQHLARARELSAKASR